MYKTVCFKMDLLVILTSEFRISIFGYLMRLNRGQRPGQDVFYKNQWRFHAGAWAEVFWEVTFSQGV
jgi:hypothetical protein